MIFSALTRPLVIGSAFVIAIFAAGVVHAQRQPTVFMLQFGSFETKEEAEAKIKAITGKHGALLSKYPALIREINMPPDNLTVYRTQAGPSQTREDAQSVCAQLASQGDECYVVETAMVAPGAAPVVQQAGIIAPNEEPPSAKEEEKIIPTDSKPLPARDPENLKALEKVSQPVSEASKTAMIETMDEAAKATTITAPKPRIRPEAAIPSKADVKDDEGSFWSWLTDDEEDEEMDQWEKHKREAAARARAEAAAGRAAPVDEVATQDMTPPPATTATPSPQPDQALAPPAPILSAQAAAPVTPSEPVAVEPVAPAVNSFAPPAPVLAPLSSAPAPEAPPVAASIPPAEAQLGSGGLKLPPPPPPTEAAKAQMMRTDIVPPSAPIDAQPTSPLQVTPAPVLANPQPESTGSITTSNLAPAAVPFKTGASVGKGGGEVAKVEVGEAQRVPLTENKQQAPVEQPVAKIVGVNEAPEQTDNNMPPPPPAQVVAPPSSAAVQKTLWAHIHYFPDQQAALAFWDGYRKAHPDFPVVRVRTTSSLVARQQGDMRVALRIGPFAQQGFINILCNSIHEVDDSIECGAITDMGASSSAYAPRDRYAQATAQSARYANQTAGNAGGFWVQLGSYPSLDEAKIAWEDARTQHGNALDDMKPAIVSPEQGSQLGAVFRLRTGPFSTQMAAKDVCSRVKVNSGACLVVSD